jgi:hypothetical protein
MCRHGGTAASRIATDRAGAMGAGLETASKAQMVAGGLPIGLTTESEED